MTTTNDVNEEYDYMSEEYLQKRFNAYFEGDDSADSVDSADSDIDTADDSIENTEIKKKKNKKSACQRKISEVQIKLRNILIFGFILVCTLSAFVAGTIRIEEAIVLSVFSLCLLYILEYSERKFKSKKESFQKACGSCFRKRQANTMKKTHAISNDLL